MMWTIFVSFFELNTRASSTWASQIKTFFFFLISKKFITKRTKQPNKTRSKQEAKGSQEKQKTGSTSPKNIAKGHQPDTKTPDKTAEKQNNPTKTGKQTKPTTRAKAPKTKEANTQHRSTKRNTHIPGPGNETKAQPNGQRQDKLNHHQPTSK